jgi:hypothetical protein
MRHFGPQRRAVRVRDDSRFGRPSGSRRTYRRKPAAGEGGAVRWRRGGIWTATSAFGRSFIKVTDSGVHCRSVRDRLAYSYLAAALLRGHQCFSTRWPTKLNKWKPVTVGLTGLRNGGSSPTSRSRPTPTSTESSRTRYEIRRGTALASPRFRARCRTRIIGRTAALTCTGSISSTMATTGRPTRFGNGSGMPRVERDRSAASSRVSSSWLPPASRCARGGRKEYGRTPGVLRNCSHA